MRETISKLWWQRYLRNNALDTAPLDRFLTVNPAIQRKELATLLQARIRYFGTREDALPEWKEAARIDNPDDLWRVWPTLPIVNKRMLQSRFAAEEMARRFGLQGHVDATGGSTGEPVRFFHDMETRRAATALNTWTRAQMGWRPGMATLVVWGAERDIGKQVKLRDRVNNWLLRDYFLDGYALRQETTAKLIELVRGHQPVAIYGFTSMLEFVARQILEAGLSVPTGAVRAAWNGGEMLFPEQSELFQRAFGVPILNRYGGRELSVMACQFNAGQPLRVMRPWQFVEIVDKDGKPVPPGETGRMLWTSTIGSGTPFLRYEIEDLGAADAGCQDESGIFAISRLEGRVSGLITLPDGRVINNLYWNHACKEFREIRQFQVRVRRGGSFHILLCGTPMTSTREQAFLASLRPLLGELPVTLQWVERITPSSSGKLLQVVKE